MAKKKAGNKTAARQAGVRSPWRRRPWFAWLLIALAIAGVIVFVRVFPARQAASHDGGQPRAAIVDQLYNLQPNAAFIAEVTAELEGHGFTIDLYQGDDVKVDLFRRLPGYGYNLIIFRAHSGMLAADGQEIERTLLFTNEPYSGFRYDLEQFNERLVMARAGDDHPTVFGITAKFIDSSVSMAGGFDDTVIIMMGCSGMYYRDLAAAFTARGASAYLAWSASVKLGYVDRATSYLVSQLLSGDLTIEEAVASTMDVIGPDEYYQSVLQYYPAAIGQKTLAELIKHIAG